MVIPDDCRIVDEYMYLGVVPLDLLAELQNALLDGEVQVEDLDLCARDVSADPLSQSLNPPATNNHFGTASGHVNHSLVADANVAPGDQDGSSRHRSGQLSFYPLFSTRFAL